MRYWIFAYMSFYPDGGMNDFVLRTDDLEEAERCIRYVMEHGVEHGVVTDIQLYDTQSDKLTEFKRNNPDADWKMVHVK